MKKVLFGLVLMVSCAAQGATPKPTITPTQKSEIIIAVQRAQIAGLQAQSMLAEATRLQKQAEDLLKTFVVPGWTLDLNKMEYTQDMAKK